VKVFVEAVLKSRPHPPSRSTKQKPPRVFQAAFACSVAPQKNAVIPGEQRASARCEGRGPRMSRISAAAT
jgi:hypothetical protein